MPAFLSCHRSLLQRRGLQSPRLLAPLLLIPAVVGGFNNTASAQAVQVGANQGVNFGQALISNSCTVSTSDGSIGVRTNRSLITSDSAEGGNFNGTLAAATVSAVSNLTSNAYLSVSNPTLNGTTAASSSQVRLGTGTWGSNAQVNLGADGSLAATPLHVRFSTSSGRFGNGTYTASATVSCYDGL